MNEDPHLTHVSREGSAHMVDVGGKPESERRAVAQAIVRMDPETAAALARGDAPKGDVIGAARLAGIQAAKRTAELIPLAHPLPLAYADVRADVDPAEGAIRIEAEARVFGRTGVEMEAMTAAAIAALTVYDMVKGIERGVRIEAIELIEKSGGRSGPWRRDGSATADR
ncbi:MAG TPA: cyclic pyranopterin monophosphate synthase MoaC [Solirubrobacterales bacterium]|nr:cyclic pyranopterin monophosphate synthase MoaC [Solirubrobacterales bacterium]